MNAKAAVVLAGGKSIRLFPETRPKALLTIENKSLLEATLERFRGLDCFVVCNNKIASSIRKYFKDKRQKPPSFLIEPEARDTAAAVAFAVQNLPKKYDWLAIASADQWMPQPEKFSFTLKAVLKESQDYPESIFILGSPAQMKPRATHSQFGWLLIDRREKGNSGKVKRFVEKPTGSLLSRLKKSGALINCGVFFAYRETLIEGFKKFFPEGLASKTKYKEISRVAFDRAIIEKHPRVRALEFLGHWEDMGTWYDWHRLVGSSPHRQKLSSNCYVRCEPDHEVYLFGISNVVVIQTGRQILVTNLAAAKNLKKYLG
jgi:mannose-1-phosphate guanylyltransferase